MCQRIMNTSINHTGKTSVFITIILLVLLFYAALLLKFNSKIALAVLFSIPALVFLLYQIVKHPYLGILFMVIGTALDTTGRVPGIGLTPFHIGAVATFFSLAFNKLYKNEYVLTVPDISGVLYCYIVLILFSLLYSPSKIGGGVDFLRITALVIVMLSVVNVITTKKQVYVVLSVLVLCSFVLSVLSLRDILGNSVDLLSLLTNLNRVGNRTVATFDNPNNLALFLMFSLTVVVSIVINSNAALWKKSILVLIAILVLAAIGGTYSRAVWLSTSVAVTFIIFYSKHRNKILLSVAAAVIVFGLVFFHHPFVQSIFMRINSITQVGKEASNSTRLFIFSGGLNMFFDSHLIGVGFGGFPHYYSSLYMPPGQLLRDVHECHSLPIEILAETGIIGIILAISIVRRFFKSSIRVISQLNDDPLFRACYIGLVAAMIGFFIDKLFSTGGLLHNWLWLGLGLVYACIKIIGRDASKYNNQLQ